MNNNFQYKSSYESLKEDLRNKIVLLDGAMGTMLQMENLTSEDFGGENYEGCNDYLVMTRPNIIKNIMAYTGNIFIFIFIRWPLYFPKNYSLYNKV